MSDTPNPPPRVSLRSRLWSLLSRLLSWHARALAWTAVGLAVVLLSAWALLQFWLLPDINLYRADIMRLASREFGVPVAIGLLVLLGLGLRLLRRIILWSLDERQRQRAAEQRLGLEQRNTRQIPVLLPMI